MTIILMDYLGRAVGDLFRLEPLSRWHVVRSIENDPKVEMRYEFEGHGVEVSCDELDRIKTVFLRRGGDGESLIDIPFAQGRAQVLQRFGTPSKCGNAVRIPGIGDRGAWDRFTLPQGVLHVQYCMDCDEIDMLTLMRPDVVP